MAATVDVWLWLVALLPMLTASISVVAPEDVGLVLVVATVWNVAGALLDRRANPALAARTSAVEMVVWAFVLSPVYVFRRQRALGQGLAPFWVLTALAGAGIAASIGGTMPSAVAPTTIDADRLETEIERTLWDQVAVSMTVDCPDHQPVEPGHRFACTVTDGVDMGTIRATVTSTTGEVRWVVE